MSSDFEEILQAPFRWPTRGDRIFKPSERGMDDALIIKHAGSRTHGLISGYRSAADKLVEDTKANRGERDVLIYPIVFLYRHYIELSLKSLVATYGPRVGIEPNVKSHDLSFLWREFTRMTAAWGVEDDGNAERIVGRHVAEFSKLDSDSFSFRYAMTTKGEPVELGIERLDLVQLRDVMDSIDGLFSGMDGYLDHFKSAMADDDAY